MSIRIASLNVSSEKGVIKTPVPAAVLTLRGIEGDAHAGDWHRQVSLLSKEMIDAFSKTAARAISYGEFAENITTEGLDLTQVSLFDRFVIGEAELEVTQIGKKCHGHTCSIFREVGACIMPKEGLFCRVTKSGAIRQGDAITYLPQSLRVLIVTVSDRASRGEYADLSGPEIRKSMDAYGAAARMRSTFDAVIIPDDAQRIRAVLDDAVAKAYDLVLMTGGTGIGPRDVTADVVAEVIEKELPGIMEFVRQKYGTQHPNALLSRSIAGTAGGTLLFAMPGSPKAVREYMSEIANVLTHCVFMLRGIGVH